LDLKPGDGPAEELPDLAALSYGFTERRPGGNFGRLTPMGNLKKKRRLKMNKHKRRKRLKSNRHKKRTWQK